VFRPRGLPDDLDEEAAAGLARSFLIVRLVRGAGLLLFLAVAVVAVELKDWPEGVAVALVLTMLLQATAMVGAWRRYERRFDRH
jgi:Na+-driven multidrug efflux pump